MIMTQASENTVKSLACFLSCEDLKKVKIT